MKKNRVIILLGIVLVMSVSSCGIFGKGCGCPTFGAIANPLLQDIKQSLSNIERLT